ncbi:flagellar basal-body MS-ring/collar protein FliF [Roseovarius sp.]
MESSKALAAARPSGVGPRLQSALSRMGVFTSDPGLRRAGPAIAATLAAGLGIMAYMLLAPGERSTLLMGLNEPEKAAALSLLTGAGLPAQLDPASGALTVPTADYHRARMMLAAEGLPTGGAEGISVLNDMPMGTSRSVEEARLRRMQEMDLARSISSLENVESARVHLALPERSAFIRETEPARASVMLTLRRGTALSAAQIEAIESLVAAAIPNLPRDAVSVVDQSGRLLSTQDSDPLAASSDKQLRHRLELESHLRRRVESMLTPILGPGNVAIEVTLDMSFTESEIMREEFDPDSVAIRSEQQSLNEAANQTVGGIPGAVTNAPPPEPEMAQAAPANAEKDTLTRSTTAARNFEISRMVETRRPQAATVHRLNAAILVRSTVALTTEGQGNDTQAPAGPDLATIEALAKSALGFDAARGDVITVSQSPFAEAAPVAPPAWHEAAWLPDIGRILLQLGILAIIAHAVLRPLLTQLLTPSAQDPVAGFPSDSIEVAPGESLAKLRARLENLPPDAEALNGGLAYSEKVALLRALGEKETGRIASVLQGMVEAEGAAQK